MLGNHPNLLRPHKKVIKSKILENLEPTCLDDSDVNISNSTHNADLVTHLINSPPLLLVFKHF